MHTHPWIKSYPSTLPWDSPLPTRAVDKILDDSVLRWPDRAAIHFMGRDISFSELGDLVGPCPPPPPRVCKAWVWARVCTWACFWPTRRTT
jgi:hypothetical protein